MPPACSVWLTCFRHEGRARSCHKIGQPSWDRCSRVMARCARHARRSPTGGAADRVSSVGSRGRAGGTLTFVGRTKGDQRGSCRRDHRDDQVPDSVRCRARHRDHRPSLQASQGPQVAQMVPQFGPWGRRSWGEGAGLSSTKEVPFPDVLWARCGDRLPVKAEGPLVVVVGARWSNVQAHRPAARFSVPVRWRVWPRRRTHRQRCFLENETARCTAVSNLRSTSPPP